MKIIYKIIILIVFLSFISSCDKSADMELDEYIKLKTNETSANVEIKEESLCGTWTLSREDNGIKITTSFEMKEDNTCVYTQTIKNVYTDQTEEVNKVSFNGKWSFDKENIGLTFNLNVEEGNNALTLDCDVTASKDKVQSFKIKDAFSEKDDYYFTK